MTIMVRQQGETAGNTRSLVDSFGRHITYVRLSVTDRCDFRCRYCMSEAMSFMPRSEVLSLEEIDRIASAFVRRGVRRLRLTGGEPLVRKGVDDLVASLGRHLRSGALDELTLTTNGSQLARHVPLLAASGVKRINVSLDSRDPARFQHITRWGRLDQVLDGIAAAKQAGIRIKINMVALKGVNDDELADMVRWCGREGFDLTLIETMPLGMVEDDRVDRYLPLDEAQAMLEQVFTLSPDNYRTGGPARYYHVDETGGRLGLITPLTHNFCDGCNRVRLTATGKLYLCLGQDDALDLREIVRRNADDEALDAALDQAMIIKPKGHDFHIDKRAARPAVTRHMSVTGG